MDYIDWIKMVPDVGFPIVLVFYLLYRLEKSMEHLQDMLEDLISLLKKR